MQFFRLASLVSAAALASANSIEFNSLDSVDRVVHFTPNAGMAELPSTTVPAGQQITVDFPQGWIGNFYSVSDGAEDKPGMLGEVAFNGWNGITFFDVSAIVDPNDHVGVKQMWPVGGGKPRSGCKLFPCNTAYYVWDDVQTQATQETNLVCTLGTSELDARVEETFDAPVFKRDFVMGRWAKN